MESNGDLYFVLTEFLGIYDKFYCSYKLIDKSVNPVCVNYKSLEYKKPYEKHFCNNDQNYYILGSKIRTGDINM